MTLDTPLHLACRNGTLSTVQFLYTSGARIDSLNRERNSPLLIACEYGHLDIVHYLYQHGASLQDHNIYYDSALGLAAKSGNISLLQWILIHHRTLSKNIFGKQPLSIAAGKGHVPAIDLLIPFIPVDDKDYSGHTAFIEACRNGHLRAAQRLYHHHATIDLQDNRSNTALYYACTHGHLNVVEWLCSFRLPYFQLRHADPCVQETLFFHGAYQGHTLSTSLRQRLRNHYRQRQLPLQKNKIGFDALMLSFPICKESGLLIGEYTGIIRGTSWDSILETI